jgi:4-amino-4-deoxy-L-arabinose transferase-like glycosyltransferase
MARLADSTTFRRWFPPLCICLTALLARILVIYQLKEASPFYTDPLIDAETYDRLARFFANNGSWKDSGAFYQPPGYTLFLALVYKLSSGSYTWARLAQAAVGTGSCFLLYLAGKRLGGSTVGFLSGMLMALYGPIIYFELDLLPTSLTLFLSICALLLVFKGIESGRKVYFLGTGLCTGIAAICWPLAGIFCIAAVCSLLLCCRRTNLPALLGSFLILAGTLIPVMPVTAYNFAKGEPVLISVNGPITFYATNNEEWQESSQFRPGFRWRWLTTAPYRHFDPETIRIHSRGALFLKMVQEYVTSSPGRYLKAQGLKLYHLVNGHEIANPTDIYFFKQYSPLLDSLVFSRPWLRFPFGLLLPLALIGIVPAFKKERFRSTPLFMFIAAGGFGITLFAGYARFRLLIVPMLIIVAALGIQNVLQSFRSRSYLRLVSPLLVFILGGLVVNNTMFGQASYFNSPLIEAQGPFSVGKTFRKKNNNAMAEAMFLRAVEIDPGFSDAWVALINLYLKEKNIGRSLQCVNQGRKHEPRDPMLLLNEAIISDQVNLLGRGELIGKYSEFSRLVYETGFMILPKYQQYEKRARNRIMKLQIPVVQ